jgi:hypothetical protein
MKKILARAFVAVSMAGFLFGSGFAMAPAAHALTAPPTVSVPAVKKSVNSICHAKGTRYYAQTKKFISYKTLKDCLKSGGRLPK